MPGGGRVSIRTANVEVDAREAREHDGLRPGSYVLLEVADTGVGMDVETLRHVFEPFFTTKELGKGTGLGLATVYGIVKQSRGYVAVDSSPQRGARFRVLLPRLATSSAADERTVEPAPAAAAASGQGGQTILVVEDQEMLRTMVCELLEGLGHRVLVASDGEEALRVAAAHAGGIQLLLADVVMPNMSGPELAQRLGTLRPAMKILFVSGYPRETTAGPEGGLKPGTPFLQKPFTTDQLEAKIRSVLGEPQEPCSPC
jgi:CheY-like chemotaxis protein